MVIKTTPQILKRISLRWLPEPTFEDTDTLALNVGGYFMDLRVTTADGSLQWSRAGERKTLGHSPLSFQWTRIIDSFGSTQADEAAFTELPNGDDLETGTFVKDGTPCAYEEVWRDVTTAFSSSREDGEPAWILQSIDESTFLGRIGRLFLGMHQGEDGSFGVRKELLDVDDLKGWQTAFESGPTQTIPRAVDVVQQQCLIVARGDTVPMAGGKYAVRALHSPEQHR